MFAHNVKSLKTYPIDVIFEYIKKNPDEEFYIDEEGNSCKLRRAKLYPIIGHTCKHCGVIGSFFSLDEWKDKSKHFDLYGIDKDGKKVLITIDHITAKSKGGKNHHTNYQCLCKKCNEIKADS